MAVKTHLEGLGWTVTVVDDDTFTTAGTAGFGLVAVSSTVSPAKLAGKLAGVGVPVIAWARQTWAELGLSASYSTKASQTQVTAGDPRWAGGVSGTVSVTTSPVSLAVGVPPGSAHVVSTVVGDASKVTGWVIAAGEPLTSGAAPAGRAGWWFDDTAPTVATAGGWALFDAVITAIGVVTIGRDPLDRPLTTTAPGATRTAYDTAGPVATLDSAGNVVERIWQLPGGVTVTVTPTAQQWTYPDLHGDTAVTATTSGVLSARVFVDPYGTPLTSTPLRVDRTTLAGFAQWARTTSTIANLAIIDLQARPYLPALGRFAALDPIPGGATPNNYAYPTDPLNTYDLDGRGKPQPDGLTAAVGSAREEGCRGTL